MSALRFLSAEQPAEAQVHLNPPLAALACARSVKASADELYRTMTGVWTPDTAARSRVAFDALQARMAALAATIPAIPERISA